MAESLTLWSDHHGGSLTLADYRGDEYRWPDFPLRITAQDSDGGISASISFNLSVEQAEALAQFILDTAKG